MTTPPDVPRNDPEKFDRIAKKVRDLLGSRAAGGVIHGSLTEEDPLAFDYADMFLFAHLRYHYDGMMVREGGTILLVMNALITRVPRDMRTLTCILEHSGSYPYTSISITESGRNSKSVGWVTVYSSLIADTLTEAQLDLALRSMLQHFHHLPLELGAPGVDVGRRRRAMEQRRRARLLSEDTDAEDGTMTDDDDDCDESSPETHKIDEAELSTTLGALDQLIGLDSVKREVNGLVAVTKFNLTRAASGLKTPPFAPHLVFVGNPGTAKTTVAHHVARIYHSLGLLEKEHVKVVSRADLVAGYVGQTALKTKEACDAAMGGMLFIDEAYALTEGRDEFGIEAIQTLLLEMENNRGRLAVVIAGYPDRMSEFLRSNPGLQSRFDRTISFPDYSNAELADIYLHLAGQQDLKLGDEALAVLTERVESYRRTRDFGNGREARRWLEAAIEEQARTWMNADQQDESILRTLSPEAVAAGIDRFKTDTHSQKSRVGYI